MNNNHWIPFKLPATNGAEKRQALTVPPNSEEGKNPSSYLEWQDFGGGSGLPEGVVFKLFDVCENGQVSQYWMATWEEEPSIEEEPAE
jgi:hypothetical protein